MNAAQLHFKADLGHLIDRLCLFHAGRADLIALLRQRARPYLFSNTLAPPVAAASIAAFDLLDAQPELLSRLKANTQYFRQLMTQAGFKIRPGEHPIVVRAWGRGA